MTTMRLSILLAMTFAIPPAFSEDPREIYARTERSVVLLKTYDRLGQERGQGTGFVVLGDLIITNHHVVNGANSIRAIASADLRFAVLSLLASDEKNDLAILRSRLSGIPPLALSTTQPSVGDRVLIVGNPLGLSKTLSEGLISAYRQDGIDAPDGKHHEGLPLIQITAPISPGSSGSPVMDIRGTVIGVAVAEYRGGQNLNFAVPVQAVSQLIAAIRPNTAERTYSSPPEGRSIIRNFSISALLLIVLVAVFYFTGRKGTPAKQKDPTDRTTTVKNFRHKA
jgi:S1-C subfamily serine protease